MQKKYQIIDMQLDYDVCKSVEKRLAQFDPAAFRNLTPDFAKELAYLIHLDFITPDARIVRIIHQAVDWSVAYFEKGDTREINGGWYQPFYPAMLLCLLTRNNPKLIRLCSWAKPAVKPDYEGPLEDEIQLLYLLLASFFQHHSHKRFDKVAAKIARCRTKNVRLLKQACDAVKNRDQEAFTIGIEACVRHNATRPKPKPSSRFMEDWMPVHANTIFLAGLQLGLNPPDFPPQIAARLMTPESIGF